MTVQNRDTRSGYAHPNTRPASSWRGRIAVMGSRGEVDGPRVDECRFALSWHRLAEAINAEVSAGFLSDEQAAELINQLPGGAAP
ncbi:hypothetical protein ABQE44_16895 [Mycolicibacterium sp. XJ2546]